MKTNEVEFINTITVSPILNTYKSEPKMKNELTFSFEIIFKIFKIFNPISI